MVRRLRDRVNKINKTDKITRYKIILKMLLFHLLLIIMYRFKRFLYR